MINTNLPPILHRFQVMADYMSKSVTSERGCLILTLSRGLSPANIVINYISLKTGFFGLHFRAESIGVSSTIYVIRPESYRIR